MKIYDAHLHFLFKCRSSDLQDHFNSLEEMGVAGFSALILREFPDDINIVHQMIPAAFYDFLTLDMLYRQEHILPVIKQVKNQIIIPYLDARYIGTDIEQKMKAYHEEGFLGLKLLHVPEEDTVAKICGMEKAFGRTRSQSDKVTARIIECASGYRMPVLIHINLRNCSDFMAEILESFPQLNFNIAHFGSYRNGIGKFLDKYPNCYTDVASLIPVARKDPQGYLDFIREHQTRILFGSDAFIGEPEIARKASGFFMKHLNDLQIIERIFNKNYLEFHRGIFPDPAKTENAG